MCVNWVEVLCYWYTCANWAWTYHFMRVPCFCYISFRLFRAWIRNTYNVSWFMVLCMPANVMLVLDSALSITHTQKQNTHNPSVIISWYALAHMKFTWIFRLACMNILTSTSMRRTLRVSKREKNHAHIVHKNKLYWTHSRTNFLAPSSPPRIRGPASFFRARTRRSSKFLSSWHVGTTVCGLSSAAQIWGIVTILHIPLFRLGIRMCTDNDNFAVKKNIFGRSC